MSAVNSSNAGPSTKKPGAHGKFRLPQKKLSIAAFALFFGALPAIGQSSDSILPGPKPPDTPLEWKRLVGIYGPKDQSVIVLERDGHLLWRAPDGNEFLISPTAADTYKFSVAERFDFQPATDSTGNVSWLVVSLMARPLHRTDAGSDPSRFYQVIPEKPVSQLRTEALVAKPPEESGPFRKSELVEIATLDPAFQLDIRYAQSKNFLSTPVYTQGRAFLQRPAAEALLRVLHKLQPLGYGLLVHDGYRPWFVTKIFWDATPPEGKIFVADPAQGSRHNRGCAVDLTLYDLKTGQPIEMTGNYDEMSPRSFPSYPGGTSLQRWHRDLLRRAMESEGFTVYESEWWHFDYKDWHEYGILNTPFEKLSIWSAPK